MYENSPLRPEDIGPLGPLPCSHSTSSVDYSKQGIGYRWPCAILGWLVNQCPCPPARDLGSRVSGLVFLFSSFIFARSTDFQTSLHTHTHTHKRMCSHTHTGLPLVMIFHDFMIFPHFSWFHDFAIIFRRKSWFFQNSPMLKLFLTLVVPLLSYLRSEIWDDSTPSDI